MTAEDIVQEVLVKVWKKKGELSAIDNIEAWCMTVTRNLSLDKLRRKKKPMDRVEDHYDLADQDMTPYRSLQSEDTMSIIREAIEALPETQQQIVHLREIEGYTYQEIADITDYKIDKVKVYLHRARIAVLMSYYSKKREIAYTKKIEAPSKKGQIISMNMLMSIAASLVILVAAYFSFSNTKQENAGIVIDDPQVALKITKDAFALINGKMGKGSDAIRDGINHLDKTFIFKTSQ